VANYFDEVTGMIVTNGLVASWDASKLASYPGSGTKWTDISGNGNDITLSGTYTYNTGTSFNMAGTGNGISGNNLLNGLASSAIDFTVNVWFNYASTSGYTAVFEKQSAVGGGIPRMDIGFGGGAFYWTTWYQPTAVVHDLVYSGTILSPNTWYQTTLTCSSSGNKSVYINGQFITSATIVASWPDGTQTLGIGGAQRKINGQIGETQIYNRALTAVEVASNFNNTRTRYGV
jgi:hypothetical protein